MLRFIIACIVSASVLLPAATAGAPTVLKLSFFTSDRSNIYQCHIKRFVDAVNEEGKGLVKIKVYFSGAISSGMAEQPQLILDGRADLAQANPGYSPKLFPDSAVMELPGLFRDENESSRVFTRLIEAGALSGYKDFFTVGAFVSAGEVISSRKPIRTLTDLKGQTIRANNQIEAETLRKFGAIPVLLPLNKTMDALGRGKIDGVTVPPAMLFEFGFGRLTSHHYLLHLGAVPITLLMSRARLASLPNRVQEIIRKYSGDWISRRGAACFEEKNRAMVARLKADPRRQVVVPSHADLATARRAFASVVEDWAKQSPRHRELLNLARAEIAKIAAANQTK